MEECNEKTWIQKQEEKSLLDQLQLIGEPLIIEKDKDGKPLISIQWAIIDFSK